MKIFFPIVLLFILQSGFSQVTAPAADKKSPEASSSENGGLSKILDELWQTPTLPPETKKTSLKETDSLPPEKTSQNQDINSLPGIANIESTTETIPAESPELIIPEEGTEDKGPWEIGDMRVEGNMHVKPKVILKTSKAKKGKLYYQSDIDADMEAILNLGSIETVTIDLSPLDKKLSPEYAELTKSTSTFRIVYKIREKPQIEKILVEGNEKLSDSSIKRAMELAEKDFWDEIQMKEDIVKITEKYVKRGFINAKANYVIEKSPKPSAIIVKIKINEGKKCRVKSVEIKGVKSFKKKKLIKKMKNRPRKIYREEEFENDIKEISDFYKNKGFSNFRIISSSVAFNDEKSEAMIQIILSEGKRYNFGKTYFSGNSVYTSLELKETLAHKVNKLFKQNLLDDSLRALQNKYADRGYLRAKIDITKKENPKTGELDIYFDIEENNPIYVAHIDIAGNKATKTFVFRREIVQKEGEVFSSSKIRRSQEKIFNLGFIDDVQLAINPTSDPDHVDLVFDIAEGKPGMLTAGAAVSSNEGLMGTLSINHLNLFGRAQRLSLSWQFGKRVQDYYLSWTTPWIKDHPTSLGVDIFNTRRYRPYKDSLSAYTQKRSGSKITMGPRFENDKYHLTASYTWEKIKITGIEDQFKTELTGGTSVTSSIYLEFARDTRDNIWDPTKGSRASIGIELSGGPLMGDVNFYKPNFSYSNNFKLFSIGDYPFVLSFANKFGYVARFGSTKSVPVYEKYFIGGADTVRGYNSNGQIGPPNGGKIYNVFNMEFKFPLARERKRTIVQWGFFLDIGNSWEDFSDISLGIGSSQNQLKAGAGFGIRFTTPAFPIRLDWGYGFNHKSGEDRSDIYFTLGNLF